MTRSRIYVDATTLIALGTIGELDLLTAFDGELVVLPSVTAEVTTEPAVTNLERFLETHTVATNSRANDDGDEETLKHAQEMLAETDRTGDVSLIGAVLVHTNCEETVALVSDDRRLRTVARGLGAQVTGTIGVIVRAVADGLAEETGRELIRRVDEHGLHMTAELREQAIELVEAAGQRRSSETEDREER